ncbi:unnamed protein product [Dicrocoelium dendriticum]|nr:unnamed protein product [Dicrocoelium dendriticum]
MHLVSSPLFRVPFALTRFVASRAVATEPKDPIQRAFLQKLREYFQKSKSNEFGLAEATPSELKEITGLLAMVDQIYGAKGQDMTKFPTFEFKEPQLVHPSSSVSVDPPAETEVEEPIDEMFGNRRKLIL